MSRLKRSKLKTRFPYSFLWPSSPATPLGKDELRMYEEEKYDNFRWVAKLFATYSRHVLTDHDLVDESVCKEVAEIGQFAEIVYSTVNIDFLIEHRVALSRPGYPLEFFGALHDCTLIRSVRGSVADLGACIFFRPVSRQLIVSISGTSSIMQALQTLRTVRTAHPSGRGHIHSGFWALYQGVKDELMNGIRTGIEEYSPVQLILTGHSMGGSMCYLLLIDLLADSMPLPSALKLHIVVFGVPRTGDSNIAGYFHELLHESQLKHGPDFLNEYSIKGYNDGIPAIPPTWLGYRHFCARPLYTVGGKLYQIRTEDAEHALFHVQSDADAKQLFPHGGHNYYNGRDLELFRRRTGWLAKSQPEHGWEERYKAIANITDHLPLR